MLRDHFKKQENTNPPQKPHVPDGMFRKCESCGKTVYEEDVKNTYFCCPRCGKHFRIDPYTRIRLITDRESFEEWDAELTGEDPLQFPEYEEKLKYLQESTGLREAVITGQAKIAGQKTAIGVMSPDFLMGSMGTAVGEKITRMIERATKERLPVILFCCSGGARMQEGIFSLMQMAKTSQALKRHDAAGLLYVSVLTDPTTGGVTASFAMLGDVILAEPGALIGFAGARVIRQTIGGRLPEGFQSAEFLQKHGFVDRIVKREQMKRTLAVILKSSRCPEKEQKEHIRETSVEEKLQAGLTEIPENGILKSAWDRVLTARDGSRPYSSDYISNIFDGFIELHGDRLYGDDRAVIGGIAAVGKQYVTVIGQQKGRNTKENRIRNFGMMNPEGYRKTLRLMKQAEKFHRPIILFVDTPGAFCGVEAEERGQGEAIARNLFEMAGLTVPVLSIVIGEGGSGGALALAVANEVWMLENSVYSVLSPEGFAAILWKDGKRASQAAEVMKLTAQELKDAGVVEKVIPESRPADKEDMEELAEVLRKEIRIFLQRYQRKLPEEISDERYRRFRNLGVPEKLRKGAGGESKITQ